MTYRFCMKRHDTLYMIERHSKSIITYYSNNKMGELYPDGGYEVIGEIGNVAKKSPELDEIFTNDCKSIPIFPRGSLKKPFEWVTGYAAISENSYVAVVKNMIPLLFS